MPIYEYECENCQDVMEAMQKFSDPALEECPRCGGRLHKIMSLGAFHLKGNGWYVTDYKGKNSSTIASDSSSGESCSADSSAPAKKSEGENKAAAPACAAAAD